MTQNILIANSISTSSHTQIESNTAKTATKTTNKTSASNTTTSQTYTKQKIFYVQDSERVEVKAFKEQYLKPFGQKQLANILENAESHRLYVRMQVKKLKMPKILEYLPVIESDYKPSAVSKDGRGVGMWQFMLNSVEPFLKVNEWVDERLDPWKETDAALSKLQDNYNLFKDWLLAIAAYNCGAGAMQRALAKTNEKTFWSVAEKGLIPDHTVKYIPKLLAVADIAENADYYNVKIPTANNPDGTPINPHAGEFDYITVNKAIALRILASELRMDESLLKSLNPALLYDITPPATEYSIRLPLGMKNAAFYAIKNILKNQNH